MARKDAEPGSDDPEIRFGPGIPSKAEFSKTRGDLDSFRGGDARAFERLWERFHPALEMIVATRVRPSLEPSLRARLDAEAEDLLQDVAITVHRRIGDFDFRGTGSLLAWMTQITVNLARDWVEHARAGRRNPRLERPIEGVGGALSPAALFADPAPGPATRTAGDEMKNRMALALAALPEREQTIVILRYFGGAEWREIAQEIGAASADAVRVECHSKILLALRDVLPRRA